jgi:hypothetical protein
LAINAKGEKVFSPKQKDRTTILIFFQKLKEEIILIGISVKSHLVSQNFSIGISFGL